MIPILYDKSETSFTSNGLGRLLECISCVVGEERNGVYECEFQYPITGKLYNEMVTNGGIISVIHDDAKDRQPFDIYKYSAPIDGIVTFNARHISYRLSGIVVKPYTATSCALALQGIGTNSVSANPFTFWTDKNVSAAFELGEPMSAKAILAGQAGSILDVYGKGEYKFDKFDVKLYTNRGTNSGVTIRYGKNLSDALLENDSGEYYNAIVPYWKDSDGALVTLPEWYVVQAGGSLKYCVPVDFSTDFETQPTVSQLRTKAQAFLANNTPWMPKENIRVDFVQLWNTEDYKNVAALERVQLCDTVAIYYPAIGLTNANAKVIKVVYDVLDERNLSIELGDPQTTLSQAIMQPYEQAIASISEKASVSFMEQAIQAATDLISGGLGGHIVINRNANGEPEEILIMDTDDKSTAVNVWRWNLNGLGHSHSGYNGPFDDIAITQDGKINASMITAGILSASLIKAGVLQSTDGRFSLDLTSGVLTITGGATINGKFVSNGQNINLRTIKTEIEHGAIASFITLNGNDVFLGGMTLGSMPDDMDSYETRFIASGSYNGNTSGAAYSNDGIELRKNGIRTFNVGADGSIYSANDLSVADDATIGGDVSAAGNVASGGSLIANGSSGSDALQGTYGSDFISLAKNGSILFAVFSDGTIHTVKNLQAIGSLLVGGNATINGNAAIAGDASADDMTVGGVLTVTNRIAEATLSSAGWYRVLTFAGTDQYDPLGLTGALIRFNIERYGNTGSNGNHQIDLSWTFLHREFVNEFSNGADVLVDKIRATTKGNEFYVDIHFAGASAHKVTVYFDVKSFRRSRFTTNGLAAVADAPSGETVVKQYSFHAHGAYIGSLHINEDFGAVFTSDLVVNGGTNLNGGLLLVDDLEMTDGDIRLTSGNIYTGGELLLPFLTKGTAIPSNADLNTYTTPGVYNAPVAVASTLTNSNITTVGVKLIVMPMVGTTLMQIEIANYDNCIIAVRFYNGSTWAGWRRITPVAV